MGDYEADAPRSSSSEQPNRGPDIERLLALLASALDGSRRLDEKIALIMYPGLQFEMDTERWMLHGIHCRIEYYTTSLDAALTLVPKDCAWRVARHFHGWLSPEARHFTIEARLERYEAPGAKQYTIVSRGATPELALCIASIRALAPPDARASGASAQESKDFPP